MEKFKQKLKTRLCLGGIYCIVIAALLVITKILAINDTATSFNLGFTAGIEAIVIFHLIKYRKALHDEEKLKEIYVQENDERKKYIDAQIGGTGFNMVLLIMILAMLVSGYFNQIVFATLLACVVGICLLKGALKIYYNSCV